MAVGARCQNCAGRARQLDLTKLSLIGVHLGQAVVVVLAVAVMSGEYGTGMIREHARGDAGPRDRAGGQGRRRRRPSSSWPATVGVLGSFAGGADHPAPQRLHGGGTATRLLSLADGPTLRAAVGSVLYLALIALLSLGVATLVREPATAIGAVLAVLYLFPSSPRS